MTKTRARRLTPVVAPARSGPRGLLAILGVTGAMVAAGLVVWLGTAPDDDAAPVALPADTALTAEGDSEEAAAEAVDDSIPLPLVTYELFLARDPFEPVVPEPVAAPPAPTDPVAPTPDDPNGPIDPSDPDNNSNSIDNANGVCTGVVEVVCEGRILIVIEIAEENGEPVAVIEVDTMRYRVGVGDVFADNFQVVSISPAQVRIVFGDRVVQLEVGDNALK